MKDERKGSDPPADPGPPIGDPPPQGPPLKADQPMEDPFTEQVTRPAGEGQGANRPQPGQGAVGENEEEAGPVEEGFSPVP
jgi:hypothetical protein